MKTPIIRYTGSPDSDPAQWLRINELTTQPGPGSAYRVTIEELPKLKIEPPVWEKGMSKWIAGMTQREWENESYDETIMRFQNGSIAVGKTREEALANLAKAKARGPL